MGATRRPGLHAQRAPSTCIHVVVDVGRGSRYMKPPTLLLSVTSFNLRSCFVCCSFLSLFRFHSWLEQIRRLAVEMEVKHGRLALGAVVAALAQQGILTTVAA